MKKKLLFGYTLVELLVVIAIIGILMSFALVSIKGTARTARDGRRKTDLELIRSGLAGYYDIHRSYPNNLDALVSGSEKFIVAVPLDPLPSQTYIYTKTSNSTYDLCAALENGTGGAGSGSKCWGTVGSCDDQCSAASTNSVNVYTTCTPSTCGGSGCWGIGESCDAGCTASSVALNTVYPNCNSSLCAGENCWVVNGKCDSGCNVASVNLAIVYTDCASQSCAVNKWKVPGREDLICITPDLQEYWSDRGCTGSILGYSTSYNRGQCSTNGSGSCYAIDGSSLRWVRPKSMWDLAYVSYCYPLNTGAGAYDRYTCTWTCESGCGQKIYIPSGSHRIKYTGSGTCSSEGRNNCYKLENGKTYFTGNALGTACGASGCSSGVYYDDANRCSWYSTIYSYSVGGSPVQAYLGRGSCNANGTGSCYKLTGGSTGYTDSTGCGASDCGGETYYSGATACSWIPFSTKLYTASGSTTKTVGSGTCTSDGTGNCYKLTGGSSYYTGNGVCGSGGCGSGTYYTGSTTCQYYAGAACNYHVKNP